MFCRIFSKPSSFPDVSNFWLKNASMLLLKLFFARIIDIASISLASP